MNKGQSMFEVVLALWPSLASFVFMALLDPSLRSG